MPAIHHPPFRPHYAHLGGKKVFSYKSYVYIYNYFIFIDGDEIVEFFFNEGKTVHFLVNIKRKSNPKPGLSL